MIPIVPEIAYFKGKNNTMPQGAIPFPFGDCKICNDKATGVHYGVATCEGCKVYFSFLFVLSYIYHVS